MILGIDVHAGYDAVRPIDWDIAAGAGVDFAIAKGTLGNEPPGDDRSFRRNVAGAKAAGVPVGFYHFAFPLPSGPGLPAGRSPREQADRAFAFSAGLGSDAGELPPALDLEWPPRMGRLKPGDKTGPVIDLWSHWNVDGASICDWALEWLEHATTLWGRRPLLYTYPDFWRSLGRHGMNPEFAEYPLWIATYPASTKAAWLPPEGAKPIEVGPWGKNWDIWQFAADGSTVRVPGVHAAPIDRNCMRDRAALRRLLGLSGAAETIPAPTSEPERILTWDVVHPAVPMGRHWEPKDDDHDEG